MTRRSAALGGIIGPAAFVAAWVIGAIVATRPYSSVDDPISRLAAVGAGSRPVMSAGFVVFGVGVAVYASSLRRVVAGPAWITATITALATLGVAGTPLDHSEGVDTAHGVLAGIGYLTLAATPLLAARPLITSGHRTLGVAGILAGIVSSISLVATVFDLPTGLLQRIGLTVTDVWIVASAAMIATGGLTSSTSPVRAGRPRAGWAQLGHNHSAR